MRLSEIFATKGLHYFVTRFGPARLRGLAFDEKYRTGQWRFDAEADGALTPVISQYLRKGDLLMMGCGGASVLEGLHDDQLNSALGVDLSKEAIGLANRFASDKISFRVADMLVFNCPHLYDVILFSESLYYVPEAKRESLLLRLMNCLNFRGVVIVTVAHPLRYQRMLNAIRATFDIIEDRALSGSNRHMIVFRSSDRKVG